MLSHQLDKSPLHCPSWNRSRRFISFSELIREEIIIHKALIVCLHAKSWVVFFYVARSPSWQLPSLLHLRQLCIHKRSFCQLSIYNFGDWRLIVLLYVTGHRSWPVAFAGYLLWLSCPSWSLHCVKAPHTLWFRCIQLIVGISAPQLCSPRIQLRTCTRTALCQTVYQNQLSSSNISDYGMSLCKNCIASALLRVV